jgi:ribosomal protein S1
MNSDMISDRDWQQFVETHQVGDVIEGVVTSVVPFGSFVETGGVTGLAYQQSWLEGSTVTARILAIDAEQRRFSLAPVTG